MADVLIVEDEQSLLHPLRYNTQPRRADVRLCTDGGKSARIVRENPPD